MTSESSGRGSTFSTRTCNPSTARSSAVCSRSCCRSTSMARWAPRQDRLADFQSGAENRCVVLASTAPTPGTPARPIIDAMAAWDTSCCLRSYASRNEFSASTGKPASRALDLIEVSNDGRSGSSLRAVAASRRRIAPILRVTSGESLAAFAESVSEASSPAGLDEFRNFGSKFLQRHLPLLREVDAHDLSGQLEAVERPRRLNSSSRPTSPAPWPPTQPAAAPRAAQRRRGRKRPGGEGLSSIRTTISSVSPIAISERRRCWMAWTPSR